MTTINKQAFLNWLQLSKDTIDIEELGKYIEEKSNRRYILVDLEKVRNEFI